MNISSDLKMKLIEETNFSIEHKVEKIDVNVRGQMVSFPGSRWTELTLDLSNDSHLFYECVNWLSKQKKIDIGPFEGIWPSKCDFQNLEVKFFVDLINPDKKNWRDWFLQGEEYASK